MKKTNPFADLLTVKQASKRTGLKDWEIYAAARSGAIDCHRPSGAKRMIFFDVTTLDGYMVRLNKLRGDE